MTQRNLTGGAILALAMLGAPAMGDVIAQGAAPSYIYDDAGRVVPRACREGFKSGYSALGSGCQRDMILMQQVANPQDLVAPLPPGPAPAAPLRRAIDRYLSGPDDLRREPIPPQPAPSPARTGPGAADAEVVMPGM